MGVEGEAINPWLKLDEAGPEYVLPEDSPYIQSFNSRLKENQDDLVIRTNRVPEPRQGPIDAPLVLLQLNPRCNGSDIDLRLTAQEAKRAIDNLRDEHSPHVCIADGNEWWANSLKEVIAAVDPLRLSRRICSIEFFPYFSRTFKHSELRLPSQTYTFELVRRALERDALILVTRGLPTWLGSVPELWEKIDETVFETKTSRRVFISKNNLPDGVYAKVLERVQE